MFREIESYIVSLSHSRLHFLEIGRNTDLDNGHTFSYDSVTVPHGCMFLVSQSLYKSRNKTKKSLIRYIYTKIYITHEDQ